VFYFLSKFLPLFIYPLGLACVLLILSLWVRRRPRWRTMLIAVALVTLWLGSNRLVAMTLLRSLEWQYLPDPASSGPQAEVIVVLGGGTRPHAYPRPFSEMNEGGDRLLYATHLYRQGAAPRILVSGGNAPIVGPAFVPEAETMGNILTAIGVPRQALLLESTSANTYENAVETQAILERQGLSRVILVTSASHMPRAYAVFDKTGLNVTPAPADFLVTEEDWAYYTQPDVVVQLFNLLPTADNLAATTRALKEYIGIAMYRLRGWL
jgi:uncharacterized SAM-binding protein YcdF (DUF218 family)